MKTRSNTHSPRSGYFKQLSTTSVASAVVLMGTALHACATEFDTGVPDLAVRWDNTLAYNIATRVHKQDPTILKSSNYDDGDRNFAKGSLITNRLDLLSEFDLEYRKTLGFRVTGAGWYDDVYKKTSSDNASLATTNNTVNGKPTLGYNGYVDRYYKGPSGELLDAFAFFNFTLGDIPVSTKVGRSVEYWGEALFSNTHAISYSQMPIDGAKAIAVPGIELKEVFRPIDNVTVRFSPTDNITVAGQYFLDWEASRGPEPGTYFGFFDWAGNTAATREALRFGPFLIGRGNDVAPNKTGDYGLSLRWTAPEIASTFGFYYRQFADKIGQGYVAGLGTATPTNFLVFPDDIKLYGMSWTHVIGTTSVAAELSYRENMPLVTDGVLQAPGSPPPASGQTTGPRGNTIHGLVNAIYTAPRTSFYDSLALQGELYWNHLRSVTQGQAFYKGRASYTGIDKPTTDYYGIQVTASPQWLQVYPGVDLSMPVSFGSGLSGVSAVTTGGAKKSGSASLGLSADVDQRHKIDLKYTTFFGEVATSPATGAITSFLGGSALLRDRAYVSLTFKTSF